MLAPIKITRPVIEAEEFYSWLESCGIQDLIDRDKLHVTQAYSRQPVFWPMVQIDRALMYVVEPNFIVKEFDGAMILIFDCRWMLERFADLQMQGCSWDYPSFSPHVTVSKTKQDIVLKTPFTGQLMLGLEVASGL